MSAHRLIVLSLLLAFIVQTVRCMQLTSRNADLQFALHKALTLELWHPHSGMAHALQNLRDNPQDAYGLDRIHQYRLQEDKR